MRNLNVSPEEAARELLDRREAARSLRAFVRQAWHVPEPSTRLIWGWHLDAICEHLEAVTRGEIPSLLINIPPGAMKSLLVSVFWPAWVWIRSPETRWLYSSYAQSLSLRDSVRCRRLIQSAWYQTRWGGRFQLTGDQNRVERFDNTAMGYRIATSVGGAATGERGDYVVVDDPHSVLEAESDRVRTSTVQWWDETMSTRVNDFQHPRRVIVMQRVHAEDLSGHVLEQGGYEHLCIPMEYEGAKYRTSIGWQDPRETEGETLSAERFPPTVVADLKRKLGPYAAAGQLQQRPAPRKGGMIAVENIEIVDALPVTGRYGRYWDKAGTEGGGDYSAGVKLLEAPDGTIYIADVLRGQWSTDTRNKTMVQTATLDGRTTAIGVEREPGSGGKESAEITVKLLRGYNVRIDLVTGDKATRAKPFAAQVEAGNVKMLRAPWNADFIAEARDFPNGKHDDQIDGASGCYNMLALEPAPVAVNPARLVRSGSMRERQHAR